MKLKSGLSKGFAVALLILAISGLANAATKGMFVVVTAEEPEVQLMAFVLTREAMKKGHYVRVLLCGPAGELALKGSTETVLKPKGESPQMLLRSFIDSGVSVNVCPLFPANRGLKPDQLLEGIGIGKPPEGIGAILEEGVKLFTF